MCYHYGEEELAFVEKICATGVYVNEHFQMPFVLPASRLFVPIK